MLKLFLDEEMKIPIKSVNFKRVESGTKRQLTIFIYNDSESDFESVTLFPADVALTVLSSPLLLGPYELGTIVLEWRPPLNLKRALETKIYVTAEEVIKPEGEEDDSKI